METYNSWADGVEIVLYFPTNHTTLLYYNDLLLILLLSARFHSFVLIFTCRATSFAAPLSCKTHSVYFALPTLFRASTFKRTQDQKPIPMCTSDGPAAHGPCALTFPLNSTSTQLNGTLNIDHKQAGGFHPAKVHHIASGVSSVLARVGRYCHRRHWGSCEPGLFVLTAAFSFSSPPSGRGWLPLNTL